MEFLMQTYLKVLKVPRLPARVCNRPTCALLIFLLPTPAVQDEDFQPLTNNKTLADSIINQEASIVQELRDIIAEVSALTSGDAEARELGGLLTCRLEFHGLCTHLDACMSTLIISARNARKQHVPPDYAVATRLRSEVASSADTSHTALQQQLLFSTPSSPSTPEPEIKQHTGPGNEDVQFAFSVSLVKMMQNSPIRHVEFKSFPSALQYMADLCAELKSMGELIIELVASADADALTFDRLMQTVIASSQRRLHVITRSFFVSALRLLCLNMRNFILLSMRYHGLPSSLIDWELLSEFINDVLCKVCCDTVCGLTVNRNKVLIRLDSLLSSWGTVVTEMTEISQQFLLMFQIGDERKIWCQFWTMLHTTLLMDLFMSVSAESNLLSKNELDYFFWYWDFICNTRIWAFDRLRTLAHDLRVGMYEEELGAYTRSLSDAGKKSGKSKGKNKAVSISETLEMPVKPVDPAISIDETLQRAKGHLCKGAFRLLVVANQWRLIVRKENKYTSWQWRFMQRFRSFQNIQNPPMLCYDEFIRVLNVGRDKPTGGSAGAGRAGADSETAAGGEEDEENDANPRVDLPVSRRILQDAALCFNNAKKLLADVKKVPASSMGESMSVDLTAPLLKVRDAYFELFPLFSNIISLMLTPNTFTGCRFIAQYSVASSVAAMRIEQLLVSEDTALANSLGDLQISPATDLDSGNNSSSSSSASPSPRSGGRRDIASRLSLVVDRGLSLQFPLVDIKRK